MRKMVKGKDAQTDFETAVLSSMELSIEHLKKQGQERHGERTEGHSAGGMECDRAG